jgi:hypothetical protein
MAMASIWSLSTDEFQDQLNSAKRLVLTALVNEKYLAEEQADEFGTSHAVIVEHKTWYKKLREKIMATGEDGDTYLRVVKVV